MWLAFATVLLIFPYPAMVDFPQHAGLTRLLQEYVSGNLYVQEHYEIGLFTPYLFPTLLSLIFSLLVGPLVAVKLVFLLSVALLPLSFYYLITRCSAADPWWSLLGFPVAFGLSYGWGLISYSLAIPLSVFCLTKALQYGEKRALPSAIMLSLSLILLFFTHLIALALTLLIIGPILLFSGKFPKGAIHTFFIVLPCCTISLLWKVLNPSLDDATNTAEALVWNISTTRLIRVAGDSLSGLYYGVQPSAVIVGILLLLALGVARFIVKGPGAAVAVGVYMCLFWLLPEVYEGRWISPRLYGMFLPILFLTLQKTENQSFRTTCRYLILIFVGLIWLRTVEELRYSEREITPVNKIFDAIEPQKSLYTMVYLPESGRYPLDLTLLHIGGYYQAKKAGHLGISFAAHKYQVIHFQPESHLGRLGPTGSMEWNPEDFSWAEKGGFDYYLLRVDGRESLTSFMNEADKHVELLMQEGVWMLFQTKKSNPTVVTTTEHESIKIG